MPFGLFGGKRAPPPRDPTDEVLPLHMVDQLDSISELIMVSTFVFNDALDADKLRGALARLLEIGDWRRAGGRLRRNAQGKLELHAPAKFTAGRPAFAYSHEAFDMAIAEHPLASRLPRPTDGPSLQEPGSTFTPLTVPPGTPKSVDDLLHTDAPLLGLRVVGFADATLVALSWSHTLGDASTLRDLLLNWSRVLAGREAEVPARLAGIHEDLVAGVAETPAGEPWVFAGRALGGLWMVLFVVTFAWRVIFGSKPQLRTAFFPARTVAAMRRQAIEELAREQAGEGGGKAGEGPAPFVSDNDIITAWATRACCRSFRPGMPVGVCNVFDARKRLPAAFADAAPFIGNSAFPSWTSLSAGEVAAAPLSRTALQLRRSLAAQTTEAQVRAQVRAMRESLARTGQPPLPIPATADLVTFSSWDLARLWEAADFGPALVRAGEPEGPGRLNRPGTMRFQQSSLAKDFPALRNVFNVIGRDHAGDWWVVCMVPPAVWPHIEASLAELEKL